MKERSQPKPHTDDNKTTSLFLLVKGGVVTNVCVFLMRYLWTNNLIYTPPLCEHFITLSNIHFWFFEGQRSIELSFELELGLFSNKETTNLLRDWLWCVCVCVDDDSSSFTPLSGVVVRVVVSILYIYHRGQFFHPALEWWRGYCVCGFVVLVCVCLCCVSPSSGGGHTIHIYQYLKSPPHSKPLLHHFKAEGISNKLSFQ